MSAAAKLEFQLGQYKVLSELGRGNYAVVYLAEKDGQYFAIKIPHDENQTGSADHERFRREAFTLARLNHPNLTKIMEIADGDGKPFIVMEYLKGASLAEKLRGGNRFSESESVTLALAVASALAEIHRNHMIHRDVKPDNIMICDDGSIRLIDLGMVGDDEVVKSDTESNVVMGSFHYLSPEQAGILKRRPDGRSDLYSLGITLYEVLTGSVPFKSDNISDLLKAHASEIPKPVSEIDATISRAFSQIISKLLNKDPDDRYQTAAGLGNDLRNIDALANAAGAAGEIVLGRNDNSFGSGVTPLQGRDGELQILKDVFAALAQGKGGAVLIEAESGMGKSRLAREALERAEIAAKLALQVKCNDKVNSIPLGTMRDAFDSLQQTLTKLPKDESAQLIAALKEASADIASGLSRVFSARLAEMILPKGFAKAKDIGEEQVIVQAQDFMKRLAKTYNVVLYVDDLQWADEATLKLIDGLMPRLTASKIAVLMSMRKENSVDFQLSPAGKSIYTSDRKTHIPLGPLKEDDVWAILRAELGGREVGREIVEKVTAASAGNPFLVQEITFALLDRGDLRLSGDMWVLSDASLSGLNLSQNVYRMILARASQLSSAHRELMTFAGIVGSTFSTDLLAKLVGRTTFEIEALLQDCLRINFIENGTARGTYSFSHDKIREALLEEVTPERMKEIYGQLAGHLTALVERNPDLILDLAHYHRRSDWTPRANDAYRANKAAGMLLLERYSYADAFSVLKCAEEMARGIQLEARDQFELYSALARASMSLALHDESFVYFGKARGLAKGRIEKAEIEILEFKALYGAGKFVESFEQMKVCLATLGSKWPDTKFTMILSILGNLILGYLYIAFPFAAGRLAKPGRERHLKIAQMTTEAIQLAMMNAYNLGDLLSGAYLTFRAFSVALRMGDSPELALAHSGMATAWSFSPLRPLAPWHLAKGDQVVARVRDPALAARFNLGKMWVYAFLGRSREAEKLALELIPPVARYLSSEYNALLLGDISFQYVSRGMIRDMVSFNIRYMKDLERTNNLMMMAYTRLDLYRAGVWMEGGLEDYGRYLQEYEDLFKKVPPSVAEKATRVTKHTLVFDEVYTSFDLEDPRIEGAIEGFLAAGVEDHHFRITFCKIAYVRLWQYDYTPEGPAREDALRKLKMASKALSARARIPLWACHDYVIRAALARIERNWRKAEAHLAEAERLAEIAGSNLGTFHAAWERAWLERARGSAYRTAKEAKHAYEYAMYLGFNFRARQINREFKVTSEKYSGSVAVSAGSFIAAGKTSGSTMIGGSGRLTLNEKRVLNSLLQVSQASVITANPSDQIRAVLDEIITVFAADRGFVLVWDKSASELKLRGGRTSKKEDLTDLVGYSTTVIKAVLEKKQPIVTTGSDDIKNLGSQSAIVHDLRSVLCVPLFLKEDFKGILYIDSRMTRGLFNQDDVGVLNAIATHIAVALESARLAVVEAERREMTKDMEVSAAVQEMLLPSQASLFDPEVSLVSLYKPAVQCGGDWWWHRRSDDKLTVFVGDVTGHGAGAAMVTTAIATTFSIYEERGRSEDFGKVLWQVNERFSSFTKGAYLMTGMALQIDTKTGDATWWSVGGPHIIRYNAQKELSYHGAGSNPFGIGEWPEPAATGTFKVGPGDRLMFATDGIVEMDTKRGRMLGDRMFAKLLLELLDVPVAELSQKLWERLSETTAPGGQNDDITFVAVEIPNKEKAS